MFQMNEALGIQEILCEDLKQNIQTFVLIDVRTPEEYVGELGHIAQTELVTLGPDLEAYIQQLSADKEYVFICRSGMRSANATAYAQSLGLTKVYNLVGGMMEWNRLGFEVEF